MMQKDTIFGKYQLAEKYREFVVGDVYRGVDVESGQAVFVTAINPEFVPAGEFLTRFELVAETLQGIETPYALQLLVHGEHEGQAVVVQESTDGQTLAEVLGEVNGLPENLVLDIAQQIGEYLKVLHQTDLVHGSLSLDTILLSSKGIVQVQDAGLAQGMNLNQLLVDGKIEASSYLAPELRNGEDLSPRADFYALGATLYEALTGEAPELDMTDPWLGSKKAGLSPELDELVAKCLQPALARRTQSVAEFLAGIEEVHRGMDTGAQDTILGMEDALVGHTLGAYQLVERLGQGGMATVYKAYEPALDRYVAIKILPQFFARDPNFMQRFRREAKAVAQLNHPNIVPIYSYGEEGNITYIAMQFVDGGTLKQTRGQIYDPDIAIRLSLPIVRALAYAHKRGIVHRDIKPSNVLLGENDWPVLADFGLAKMAEASGKLTGTGVGIGTPMYMSPEQGQGTGVDHRTDIYSMGIMLYEMLTGDVPFRADTPMAVVIKHMTAPLPMPREINPDIPEALERIILKATSKSADDRYQTADEMVTALERVQNTLLAGVAEPTRTEIAAPAVPREKSPLKKAGIILGGIAGILLLGVILMWAFDICPPPGPWPIPPWCPGSPYELPTIGGVEEPAPLTDGTLGAILFQDDFEGEISSRWQFTSESGLIPWAAEEVDGRTVMHSIPPDTQEMYSGAEIRDTEWENYAVQFDFRFVKPDQFGGYYFSLEGQITDCPPTIQSLQAYMVTISSDKVIVDRSKCEQGGAQRLVESDKDIDPDEWHTLQYIFIGNRIQVIIDGDSYIDYVDEDNPIVGGGDIWLSIRGGVEIYVDNLKVYEVIPGEDGEITPAAEAEAGADVIVTTEIYADDFENGFADFWSAATLDTWRIEDAGETHALRGSGPVQILDEGLILENFKFDIDFNFAEPSSNEGYYGAAFFFRQGDCSSYYLEIYPEGGGMSKNSCDADQVNYGSALPIDINPGEWHHVQVRMVGNHIRVLIDGEVSLDFIDDGEPIEAGEFSFGGHEFEDITYFDNFSLEVLEYAPRTASSTGEQIFIDSGQRLGKRYTRTIAAGDVDGDGEIDIIAGNSGQTNLVWLNSGDGLFLQGFETSNNDHTSGATIGDYNGDGYSDLFFTNFDAPSRVWLGNDVGSFGLSQSLKQDNDYIEGLGMDAGDLDNDGDIDIWMAAGGNNYVWINDGSGAFSLSDGEYPGAYNVGAALGDLDRDGDLDAFIANYFGGANFVYMNQGDGSFTDSGQHLGNFSSNDVALGDLDGDGDLDAFVANLEDQPNTVWLNNGAGVFVDSGQRLDQLTSNAVALGDLDNDGDLDAYVVNGEIDTGEPESNTIYLNDGLGNFTSIEHVANLMISTDVVLLDLNGDGWLDIVEATTETILVYFNQGNFDQAIEESPASASEMSSAQYFDDFEDGLADFWGADILATYRVEEFDNNHILRGSDWGGFWEESHLTDFELEVDFYPAEPSAAEGLYGIEVNLRVGVCPLGSDISLTPYYSLEILDNGLGLMKFSCDGSVVPLDGLMQGISPQAWHTLKARLVGNRIQIFVDDFLAFDYIDEDQPYMSGTAILFSGLSGEDITYFDNFSLKVLSSENETEDTQVSSPCDFTLDDVGQSARVAGTINFIDDFVPEVWYADLVEDGCTLGIHFMRQRYPAWLDEYPEIFTLGAAIDAQGVFVSYPYPDNPDEMQLILELTELPKLLSSNDEQ